MVEPMLRIGVTGAAGVGKTALIWRFVAAHGGVLPLDLEPDADGLPAELPRTLDDYVIETIGDEGQHDIVVMDMPVAGASENISPSEAAAAAIKQDELRWKYLSVLVLCVDPDGVVALRESLHQTWLPMLSLCSQERPIPLLVCVTKADQRLVGSVESCEDVVAGWARTLDALVMELESDFQVPSQWTYCSAHHSGDDAGHVMKAAIDMVISPLYPLFDATAMTLRPSLETALRIAFERCDQDRDGCLSDDELQRFQTSVFGVALTRNKLQEIKEVLPQGSLTPHVDSPGGALTFDAFLHLHLLMAKQKDALTIWRVLRHYNLEHHVLPSALGGSDFFVSSVAVSGGGGMASQGGEELTRSISSSYVKIDFNDLGASVMQQGLDFGDHVDGVEGHSSVDGVTQRDDETGGSSSGAGSRARPATPSLSSVSEVQSAMMSSSGATEPSDSIQMYSSRDGSAASGAGSGPNAAHASSAGAAFAITDGAAATAAEIGADGHDEAGVGGSVETKNTSATTGRGGDSDKSKSDADRRTRATKAVNAIVFVGGTLLVAIACSVVFSAGRNRTRGGAKSQPQGSPLARTVVSAS